MMIDLHTHCLPGIDDGAQNVEESLSMLKQAYLQRIECIAATPHCRIHYEDSIASFTSRRQESFDLLNKAIEETGAKTPQIILGAEVFLDNDIAVHSDLKKVCLTGTNIILIELNPGKYSANYGEWIYNLTVNGYQPLIAHIDRYFYWKKLMTELSDVNVYYQINAERMLSFWGRRAVKELLANDLTFVFSSDMHGAEGRNCNMEKARIVATKKFGEEAKELFYLNAKTILEKHTDSAEKV